MKKLIIVLFVIAATVFSCTKDSEVSGVSNDIESVGQGGSMARISISNDHLFLINEYQLKVYNIENASQPQLITSLNVDYGIETVFTLDDFLFIGSINGMYIYDISNPQNILYMSYYQHITSCDPVVANDSLAFVTLNSSSSCWWQGGANRLDVLDITNKVNPIMISSTNMTSPKGLGLYQNYVIVCNGESGVEIFDYSNPNQLQKVSGISGIDAYDVIIRNDHMILIGKDGLFQYLINDIQNIQLVSNILFQ